MSKIQIENKPDINDLWAGIGGHFDSLSEILCEFIDNSISNFRCHHMKTRSIILTFKEKIINSNEVVEIQVEDSGTGIKKLNASFTLGSKKAAETPLNEHGFGFKHALATANPENDNWEIITCTKEDNKKGQYKKIKAPYALENFKGDLINKPWIGSFKTGTIIRFCCTRDMFRTITRGLRGNYRNFNNILKILSEELGYVYSGVLKENSVFIQIVGTDLKGIDIEPITVRSVEPVWEKFYLPKQSTEMVDLGNGKVKISYVFGSMVEHPETKRYYKRNLASSGAEIRINGRLLASNVIRAIWEKEPHPVFNHFLAQINIISDDSDKLPKTKTSKNGLREGDEKLVKLFEWIRKKRSTIPKKSEKTPEDVDEKDMFKELKDIKINQLSGYGNPVVEVEKNVFATTDEKIRADLYVSLNDKVTIYEGKKDKTTIKDLYQLMMYWDGLVYDGIAPDEAILISAYHPESVHNISKILNEKEDANNNKYNFILKNWTDESINYPK